MGAGQGPTTAMTLMSEMPELGAASAVQISSLAGAAPMNRDSGTDAGAPDDPGRPHRCQRRALHAAVVARRWNESFTSFYERFRGTGKPVEIAINAVMRKPLVLANTLVRGDRVWTPLPP